MSMQARWSALASRRAVARLVLEHAKQSGPSLGVLGYMSPDGRRDLLTPTNAGGGSVGTGPGPSPDTTRGRIRVAGDGSYRWGCNNPSCGAYLASGMSIADLADEDLWHRRGILADDLASARQQLLEHLAAIHQRGT